MDLSPDILDSKLLVLTGAGASVPLGRFTTRQFLEYFADRPLKRFESSEQEAGHALRELLSGAVATELDIEHILDGLERRANSVDRLALDPHFVRGVLGGDTTQLDLYYRGRAAARDAIYDEVILHYGQIDSRQAADLYRALFKHCRMWLDQVAGPMTTLPVFTLNYDLAVEAATSELRIRRVDGITDMPGATERRWTRTAFEEYHADPDGLAVVLVKLHGSVRLGYRSRIGGRPTDIDLVELPNALARDPAPYKHSVLYPTLGAKPLNHEPFHTHYRIINSCLLRANLLLAIGCSFRDPEVQIALRTGIEDNPRLRILAIGPHADHEDIAGKLDIDRDRVAAVQRSFEIEDADTVERGKSIFMGTVRGYFASAIGDDTATLSFPFGRTVGAAPAAG